MNYTDLMTLGSLSLSTIAAIGGLVWFISNQFSKIRSLVYESRQHLSERIETTENKILAKLEYHERHDDQRFAAVTNDLWTIRVRNAAIDGAKVEKPDQCPVKPD